VTSRTIVLALGVLLIATLATGIAGGLALGYRLAGNSAPEVLLPFDAGRPDSQALIERVGSLSARLIRLESEAETLASRVGVMPAVKSQTPPATTDDAKEPSGGPLLAPAEFPELAGQPDIFAGLANLESGLDAVDAAFSLVTRRTTASDLAGMAFPSRYPIAGARISSGFGNRRDPFTQRLARHTGVDMPAPAGTPILAAAGGTVRFAGLRRAYGNAVEIDHGDGLVTRYAHASKVLVHTGQVVLPEQAIATVGSTGRSTGPHLHFEVLRDGAQVEPLRYLDRPGQ
jgi:murein DD-endopeptidase MepM/ murein hydrolase activator NlpD